MKYSKEFYMLIAHINPALYDVIFPMGPLRGLSASAPERIEYQLGNYRTNGSVYGTDLSGELRLWAKLTWKMHNLVEDLRVVTINAKISGQLRGDAAVNFSFISELIDDWCGTVPIKIKFPPRPHGIPEKFTIEEKVGAAALFAYAAFSVEGTEIAGVLGEGADKILESALTEFADVPAKQTRLAFEKALSHS